VKKHKALSYLSIFLGLLLILFCICALFIPHTHGASEPICAICILLEEYTAWLANTAPQIISSLILALLIGTYAFLPIPRNTTPIGLKVKLSD
jgi:hypothetical protein